ncbi:MAG: PQQ-binding-like beta-propeller repeat protein [Candidatus Acidiferrales bacterium]
MPERLQNSLNVPDAAVWIRYNRNPGNRISLAPNSSKRMMPRRLPVWLSLVLIGLAIILQGCAHQRAAVPEDGAALFAKKCAECHQEDPDNDMRAPTPQALRLMSRSAILASLETGRMRWEAKFLSKAKKTAIANYLGAPDVTLPAVMAGLCPADLDPPANPPGWAGWGGGPQNSRFQPASAAGLDRDKVKNLKFKWAFGFPGAGATFGQPTSFAGKIFVGSEDGTVYALDAATGCRWWSFKASATVKTAISVGNHGTTAFFGDTNGFVYAVKVADASLVWKVQPGAHPAARITGSPLLVGDRLYVPISSGEEGASADPLYPCCTFRGGVVALDATTGKQIWRAYTIADAPKPTRKSAQGVQYWGPSGAAVWSSPTADLKRHAIYVATGNNYSDPPTQTSDSVIAFDIRTGKKLWSRQFTAKDMWNSGCVAEKKDNCPAKPGDDFDFGSPPVLKPIGGGRDVLLLSQKSGMVYALDPDLHDELVWKARIGRGGPLGGIEWGGAVDGHAAYFPLSDFDFAKPLAGGGLFALNLRTGRQVWHVAPPKPACAGHDGCSAAQMAPPTLIPGVLFAGSLDGHLRAYDTRDGTVLWDFDTAQDFHTTNGVKAHGGSLNGAGPLIVSGMVYVNTGYDNAMAGNVLLAFSLDAK